MIFNKARSKVNGFFRPNNVLRLKFSFLFSHLSFVSLLSFIILLFFLTPALTASFQLILPTLLNTSKWVLPYQHI